MISLLIYQIISEFTGVKRERDSTGNFQLFQLEEERQLTWGWGFVGGPITIEEDPEGQSDFNSGYHSAETEIISDSEDDLFFLDGESATKYHCK